MKFSPVRNALREPGRQAALVGGSYLVVPGASKSLGMQAELRGQGTAHYCWVCSIGIQETGVGRGSVTWFFSLLMDWAGRTLVGKLFFLNPYFLYLFIFI